MNPLPGPRPRGAGPWPRQWPWPLIAYDIGTTYAQYHEANRPSHKLEHKIYDYYSENFAMSPEYKIYYHNNDETTSTTRRLQHPQQRRNDVNNNKKVTTPTTTTKQRQQHEARAIHNTSYGYKVNDHYSENFADALLHHDK